MLLTVDLDDDLKESISEYKISVNISSLVNTSCSLASQQRHCLLSIYH